MRDERECREYGARRTTARAWTFRASRTLSALTAWAAVAALPAAAQSGADAPGRLGSVGAETPAALAELVVGRFAAGTQEAFDSVYPGERGRALVAFARRNAGERRPGDAVVIASSEDRAVLLLSGWVAFGNSGSETTVARDFSGLYEARRADGSWRLGPRIAIDSVNRIREQALGVRIHPGRGLDVRDTLTVDVRDPNGFWVYLNHVADIRDVRVDGKRAEHRFGGGLLWVRAPAGDGRRLALDYVLDMRRDSATNANSGRFEDAAGHARNQYWWHPFYDFHSVGDLADFRLTARVPRAYHVATSLEQTDTVVGADRIVTGRSSQPTFALTLMYDRDWRPVRTRVGSMRVEIFATPDFQPTAARIVATISHAYETLLPAFGEPGGRYLAVAQARARGGQGWAFRSNDLIVAGAGGGLFDRGGARPRAFLAHEVSHGWTHPTGLGGNFLAEGWASFAEPLMLAPIYGPAVVPRFWESYRTWYERSGYDGTERIDDDPGNSGVAYNKGSWILHMLEETLGDSIFDAGMRRYMAIPAGRPAGLEEFSAAMSAAAGHDVRPFLAPWLHGKTIPDIDARVEGDRIVLSQTGAVFRLPLDVLVLTRFGALRRHIQLTARKDTLVVPEVGPIEGVRLDPDHRLLIRRQYGDTVTLAVHAPGAGKVALFSDFSNDEIPASRTGDTWAVSVTLTEGTYMYAWHIDDDYGPPLDLVVDPVERVDDAYPRGSR